MRVESCRRAWASALTLLTVVACSYDWEGVRDVVHPSSARGGAGGAPSPSGGGAPSDPTTGGVEEAGGAVAALGLAGGGAADDGSGGTGSGAGAVWMGDAGRAGGGAAGAAPGDAGTVGGGVGAAWMGRAGGAGGGAEQGGVANGGAGTDGAGGAVSGGTNGGGAEGAQYVDPYDGCSGTLLKNGYFDGGVVFGNKRWVLERLDGEGGTAVVQSDRTTSGSHALAVDTSAVDAGVFPNFRLLVVAELQGLPPPETALGGAFASSVSSRTTGLASEAWLEFRDAGDVLIGGAPSAVEFEQSVGFRSVAFHPSPVPEGAATARIVLSFPAQLVAYIDDVCVTTEVQ
ncbi:MAG: hypothetical protein JW751_16820 [Polyangiaceae bacterium]|nr:hypothetical protein [Polyangiaceae bacterium]